MGVKILTLIENERTSSNAPFRAGVFSGLNIGLTPTPKGEIGDSLCGRKSKMKSRFDSLNHDCLIHDK